MSTLANDAAEASSTLPRQERALIVLLALMQGLLLYLAEQGQTHGVCPLAELHGRVCWYSLVLVVTTMMMLSLHRIADRRFALQYWAAQRWFSRSRCGRLECHRRTRTGC